MVTQRTWNTLVLSLFTPLFLSGCVFGENKQFFESASVLSAGLTNSDAEGTANASPTPSSSPAPTTTPDASATPSIIVNPTATPIATATPTASATPSPTPECTVSTTTKDLRILFMIDNSGSTATTDPAHNYRVKTIQDFLGSYGSHTNLSYSFGYFSGTTSPEWDMVRGQFQTTASALFGDATGLANALNTYERIPSSGNTPYSAAFSALKNEVHADEANGSQKDYVVVFMSDGQPTDIHGNIRTSIISMVDDLRTEVQSNGKSLLTVSSVYFGPENDFTSIGNLQAMATQGSGQFVDTNITQAISIHDIISVPSCH